MFDLEDPKEDVTSFSLSSVWMIGLSFVLLTPGMHLTIPKKWIMNIKIMEYQY